MGSLTLANYLGMLQADPDNENAISALRDALQNGGGQEEDPVRLLEMARMAHEQRGELRAAAWLIELEAPLITADPDLEAALFKELGRIRHEELLDDAGAKGAYERALELRPGDHEIEDAIEQVEQMADRWKEIAKRFVEEANDASDATLKTSLLTRAASLVWQYKKKGRDKEVDKLFKAAIEADPASTRTARLFAETLRTRERFDELAQVLAGAADHARNRDEKLNLYVRAGRVYAKNLEDKEKAAQCYERVRDFSPGHEEALRFLVEYLTELEAWDRLVALYEDALRSRQKLEAEQGILLQIGMVHWRIRQSAEEAEPYFGRLRKIDPAHPGMLSFYREFFAGSEDPARFLTILSDAQRVTKDAGQKLELAVELARTAQANEATVERAVDAWKAVQRQSPEHPEARAALRELYAKAEKWNALVELLKQEIDSLPTEQADRKVELLREMVPIYRDKLSLDVMVINTYNAILALVPDDAPALAELARTYEAMGRWNDLIQVLTRQGEAAEDPTRRVELYSRVADLWIEHFANYNQAVKPLEVVVEIDPENRRALSQLKEIYEKKRAWSSLFEVLKKESELASDPAVRLANKVELAKLAGERLHKNSDAIALWREVVEQAPETEGALDALERLAEREKDWGTLAEVLERRASAAEDDAAQIKVLTKLGTVYGEHLEDPAMAANAWQRVLALDPKNGRATRTLRESFLNARDWEGLEALYSETDDWEGLVEVLGSAAERTDDVDLKVALSYRAAEIYEGSIGEPHRAFRNYERVLSVRAGEVRAAEALLPIYERDENWPKVVAMKETLLGALGDDSSVDERLALINELRRLSREQLSNGAAAFAWAKQGYALAPEEPNVVTALESEAAQAEAFEELAAIYEARLKDAGDDEAMTIRRRLAAIAGEHLGKTSDAISRLQQILEADPSDGAAVEVLDRLYRAEGRTDDLRALYQHRIDNADDNATRVTCLRELAALEEDVLDSPAAAIGRLTQLLTLEPDDAEALEALDRLYSGGDLPTELADVLRRRRELDVDEATRIDLVLRLADLLRERLHDPRGALDAYSDVLRLAPGHDAAVSGLESLSAGNSDLSVEVGRLLESAYESKASYQKLASVLEKRLSSAEDPAEMRELQLRLAELAGSELGDVEGAYNAIEAAFLSAPADRELWDRLADAAERAGKHEGLAGAYAMALDEDEIAGDDARELASRAARIHDELLGTPAEAEPFHRRVLVEDPLDERAFEALKGLFTDGEKWDDLQVLYRNRIAETVDGEAKRELLLEVCFLFEELLDDPGLAIRAYQDVIELEPDHVASRRALDRLYRRTERWRDLAALLQKELDRAEGQDLLEATFELGQLHEQKLDEPVKAIDFYEQVLIENPTHLRSQEALERLLRVESQRQRIAAILEPLYEEQGAYAELAKILEVQLEDVSDPGSQVGLLLRIAELAEVKNHDNDKAFSALSRAVKLDPADSKAREELARLATLEGADEQRAAVLEAAIEVATDGYLRSELWMELARLYDEQLSDVENAERAYTKLIEVDGDNPEVVLPASRALERIHLGERRFAALAKDLRRQVALVVDGDEKKSLMVRLADLLEETLEDIAGAIDAHRERLEFDPSDLEAMSALERLYERTGQWQQLIGVLQTRDNAIDDAVEQQRIARVVGDIYENRLEDADNAIVAYNDALARFGADRKTLGALARLYESTEKWDDLLEVIQQDLEQVDDAIERAELRFRAAELMRNRTGEIERAIDAYSEVLSIAPEHEGTAAALEAIMGGDDRISRIAAARVLVPRFEGSADYDKLISVLSVVGESDDPTERLSALKRAAEVADVGLESPERAFALTGQAIKAALGEPDLEGLLADLERHAVASERFEDYVALLREIAPDIFDGELMLEVLLKIADTAVSRLENDDLAARYYDKVLADNPEHADALDALEALKLRQEDHRGLLAVLARKTELASDPGTRIDLLLRQAELSETALEDVDGAIDAYERVLGEEERPAAFDGLERLYRRAERFDDLASVLERRLDAIAGGAAGDAVAVRYRLGRVFQLNLDDTYRAIDAYRDTLAQNSGHEETIAALEELMEADEHRAAAAEILEPVFLQKMDWPKVTAALEARVAAEDIPDEKKTLLGRLGQIHEDYLEDLDGALEIYARLFRVDPVDESVWDTLTRLARNLDKQGRLAEVYAEALAEITVDEPATAKLSFITGRLHDEKTGDLGAAAKFYRRALDFDPTDSEVFEALSSVHRRLENWDALSALHRERMDVAQSDEERVRLLHVMATVAEEQKGEPDTAIDLYREILESDPREAHSIDALDRLFTQRERWEDLSEHIRHRIDLAIGTDDEVPLKHRLGELLADRLGDRTGALDVFEEITQAQPSFAPTVAKLEQMVQQGDDQLRITQILEPIYRGTDEWRKLIAILEAQAQLADDPVDRVRFLGEVGRLHEERGRDGVHAFDAWSRAFCEDPHDEATRGELDRLAELLDAWNQHVAAYEAALEKTDDPTRVTELLNTIADVHDQHRGDPRSAIETYERILAHDSEVTEPLEKLESLHTMVGDWRGMVDVLGRRVERSFDPEQRGELLRRQGSVLQELLGDRPGAIEAYEKACVENDSDDVALEALDRLYQEAGDSEKLGDILSRRLVVEPEAETRVELAMRLGTLLETQLNRPEDAIDAFNRVLDDEGQHTGAIEALARLYERQAMWPELLENLRLRASLAAGADERVKLTHRAGEVLERELDDVHEALAMYEEALGLDGRFQPTIAALVRIANLEDYRERAAEIVEPRLEIQERWDELAALLTLKVDAATDPLERRDQFRRIAEVHEQGRDDKEAAFEAISRALAEDPTDKDTADDLERLGALVSAPARVADVLGARAAAVLDPMAARGLYTRLARIAEEDLNDDQRAIEAFARAAEQVGDDDELLASLDRLYAKTEKYSDLADVLDRRIGLASDPDERNAFLIRLGTIKEQHHGDLRGAFNAYQEVLEREPGDPAAVTAMERLAEHEELALEVVETLDQVYRQTGQTAKVADLYDVRIRLADSDGERVRLLIEVAQTYETELGQLEKALDAVRRAFELDPRDQSLLEDLERLAGAVGGWESLRGVVERVAETGDVENLILKDLNLRAASWYQTHLGDVEAAEARLRAAIDADPDSGDGYERLADLLRTGGREADLVAVLSDWARVELDERLKRERYAEAARLAESALGQPAKAAECYEAILAFDPNELETLGHLTRLRRDEERWDDVVELLDRRIDAEMDPQTRHALRHELAQVHTEHRGAPEDAITAYSGVLDEDPTDTVAMDALTSLYEAKERWQDLSDVLERRLDVAQDQDEQIAVRVRLARLSEQRFGRREEAMEQLRAILDIQPDNGDALDELERLLGLDEKWEELVELLERRVGAAAEAGQGDVEVDILIRLAAVQEDALGDADKAIATHQRVLERNPQHDGALRALLALHEKAGDWNAVAGDLDALIGVAETDEAVQLAHRLAEVATAHLEDAPRAEAALRRAYELDTSRDESREKLKAHYEAHEQWAELATVLADEEASAPDDKAKVALLRRIASIYEEQLGDPGLAAQHLERAAQLTPEDRDVLLPLCDLYIAAGRSQDAIPVLRKIIESYGTRRVKEVAQFHHRLGKALAGMGDEDGALASFDNAFKIDLTNVSILRDLGKLCHARGDFDRAQKTFRALLLQKLDDKAGITKADVYFFLGDISAKQGDPRKAKSMLQRALAENKEHAEAKALLDSL